MSGCWPGRRRPAWPPELPWPGPGPLPRPHRRDRRRSPRRRGPRPRSLATGPLADASSSSAGHPVRDPGSAPLLPPVRASHCSCVSHRVVHRARRPGGRRRAFSAAIAIAGPGQREVERRGRLLVPRRPFRQEPFSLFSAFLRFFPSYFVCCWAGRHIDSSWRWRQLGLLDRTPRPLIHLNFGDSGVRDHESRPMDHPADAEFPRGAVAHSQRSRGSSPNRRGIRRKHSRSSGDDDEMTWAGMRRRRRRRV